MRISRYSATLITLAGILSATTSLFGQAVNNAQIHGAVTDPTGAAVVGAKIRATHTPFSEEDNCTLAGSF